MLYISNYGALFIMVFSSLISSDSSNINSNLLESIGLSGKMIFFVTFAMAYRGGGGKIGSIVILS